MTGTDWWELISEAHRSPPLRYFEFEGDVYTVVNPSRVESLPGIPIHDPESNLTCRDLRKAIWALGRAPEMAYMLKHYNHELAFFSRLNCDSRTLPIEKTEHGYALRHDVRASWQVIENVLIKICATLLEAIHGSPEARFPFDSFWRLPQDHGYRSAHRTSAGASKAALRSRDACVLLLARCTMAIALCGQTDVDPPAWIRVLVTNGFPSPWIDILRSSIVADLSPGLRTGAFIDPFGVTQWVDHVPCMIRANLPVYLRWKRNEDIRIVLQRYPFLRTYLPPHGPLPNPVEKGNYDLRFAWSSIKHAPPHASPTTSASATQTSDRAEATTMQPVPPRASPVLDCPPEKPHGPGQLPGETWREFLDRRAKRNHERSARAGLADLASYDERRRKAESYSRPTRPTQVFLWKEAGDLDDFLPVEWLSLDVRVQVSRKNVGDLWPMYSNAQKVYDPCSDEWDICPQLAPEDTYDYEDEAWDEDEGDEVVSLPPVLNSESSFYASDLQFFYDLDSHSGFRPVLEDFSALSRRRYGLLPIVNENTGIQYDRFGEASLRKCFGLVQESMSPQTQTVLRPASGLVAAWLENEDDPRAPGLIWDLEPTCDSYLALPETQGSRIQLTSYVMNGQVRLRVAYEGDPGEDGSRYWSLFVDEVTGLELRRRSGIEDVKSAILFLARRGSAMTIAFCPDGRDRQGIRNAPAKSNWLGWRPAGFRADYNDYIVYEQRARDVLCQPRARAALLRGGIVCVTVLFALW